MLIYKGMKKVIIFALLVTMILLPPLQTHAVSRKTQGKIILASILTGIAILTKLLEEQDRKDVEKLHKKLGTPDHVIEFHQGFDKIRIECWKNRKYTFKNGVLQRPSHQVYNSNNDLNKSETNIFQPKFIGDSQFAFPK